MREGRSDGFVGQSDLPDFANARVAQESLQPIWPLGNCVADPSTQTLKFGFRGGQLGRRSTVPCCLAKAPAKQGECHGRNGDEHQQSPQAESKWSGVDVRRAGLRHVQGLNV
jgi:hypothetical protein